MIHNKRNNRRYTRSSTRSRCDINNKKQGGSFLSRGGDYRNPPQVAWMDRRAIAMVAVPMR
ncbi:hypothetical protein PG997_008735 [Apiospora hydei]|uniref:Uncharacterized protein n=1 Tax=Apiospora hydei TaxID=1337664 RepID=A0ABR1WD27_9PEZI